MTYRTHRLPDVEIRRYPPDPDSDDASAMYVLDVLGFQLMVRRQHADHNPTASVVEIADDPGAVLTVHVRGTTTTYQ